MVQSTPAGKREGRDVGEGRRTRSVSPRIPPLPLFLLFPHTYFFPSKGVPRFRAHM
jgi:hypothetical protein